MNQNYYSNIKSSDNEYQYPYNNSIPNELLYIDTTLKRNIGKKAKIHTNFPNQEDNKEQLFEGIIENSGKDHIIISNPNTGEWNLIPFIYLNYISFEEPINN